jgi:antitoxin (DNA-binding transcriptional repressor) of toxin-antitoxin stability system
MTISIQLAQSSLEELIGRAARGEKVLITRDERPVAELVAVPTLAARPVFGSCRGMLTIVADDDEHLTDFKEYME